MGVEWTGPGDRPVVSIGWDEHSRDRQEAVLLLLAVCLVVAAVGYLTLTPNVGEPGYRSTTTTTTVVEGQ